jgi:hypothetical protein
VIAEISIVTLLLAYILEKLAINEEIVTLSPE